MTDFSSFLLAGDFQNIINKMVDDRIAEKRPRHKYAVVQGSIDYTARTCMVMFNGDTSSVKVSFGATAPTSVGQVVRIEGVTGDRYIADIIGLNFAESTANSAQTQANSALARATVNQGDFWPGQYYGGWANFNAGWRVAGYVKQDNYVTLRGLMCNVGGPLNAWQFYSAFTLPGGFIPAVNEQFLQSASGGGCRIDILSNGVINVMPMVNVPVNGYISISGISYSVF